MMYQQMVLGKLADPPVEFLQCSSPPCSVHASLLDNYASHFVSTLLDSCFPCHSASKPRVPGWNESAGKLKELSIFWNRVWTEAGCPSAGVLSTIKRHAKKRSCLVVFVSVIIIIIFCTAPSLVCIIIIILIIIIIRAILACYSFLHAIHKSKVY